jgi:L-rhamnonate dehydratase
MSTVTIKRVEWATLSGRRRRAAGENARIGKHGIDMHLPIVRLTDSEGFSGFGCSWRGRQAAEILDVPLDWLIDSESGVFDAGRDVESPLWDLLGQRMNQPVYRLTASIGGKQSPDTLKVPCYDTSLYFDDLHLTSTSEAAALIAQEAYSGYEKGHRAFKIKVGRGARHMELLAGIERDIAVIQAVRQAVGPTSKVLIDANNGYNLNITKTVLSETADCYIHWIEEAFHEDDALYEDLKNWMTGQGIDTLIADGEGLASPELLNWARRGLVDVIQYDIFGHGLTRWIHTGKQLDRWKVMSAPHAYGNHLANYASAHLSTAIDGFALLEWDEATTDGLDTSAYSIDNGYLQVPNSPGFGLKLDEETFRDAVKHNGGEANL